MKSAFSLVELSIVLVILGLLTGGILAGQSLIRAAEIRSVSTDVQKIISGVNVFRDKYMGLPGDITNATRFWGDNAAQCADAAIANGTPGTCNGNGDGLMYRALAHNNTGEIFQAWNQLALTGLIEGSYTGLNGPSHISYHSIPGTNVPAGKIANTGWSISGRIGMFPGNPSMYAVEYGAFHLIYGTAGTSETDGKALRPEELWNVDTKTDDGRPASGKIIARYWNSECSLADDGGNASTDLNASYNLTDTDIECAFYLRNLF